MAEMVSISDNASVKSAGFVVRIARKSQVVRPWKARPRKYDVNFKGRVKPCCGAKQAHDCVLATDCFESVPYDEKAGTKQVSGSAQAQFPESG